MDKFWKLLKKITPSNIWHFSLGHYRYIFFFRVKGLLRKHIREQIEYRIKIMNPKCYEEGECIMCGCSTPELQMANKVCEGRCYPSMMNKDDWKSFKKYIKYGI